MSEPSGERPSSFQTEVNNLGVLTELYQTIVKFIENEGAKGEGHTHTVTASLPKNIGPYVTNDYIPPPYTLKVGNRYYKIEVKNVVVRREELSGQLVSEITAHFSYSPSAPEVT